jgi:rhodanese-related sulfurtransferase|tara:strand:+ start:150 stop:479 length:330 start_codon:yes stop_codon:yes gene_type:complete
MFNFLKNLFKPKPTVNGQEAYDRVKGKKAVLLDVRESVERRGNHIKDSLHIPLTHVKSRMKELNQYKDKEIIVYCASGMRSSLASLTLNQNGFNAFNLSGGISAYPQKD